MRVAWATDLHLNFVDETTADELCRRIVEARCEAVLIGGDTAEADDLRTWLRVLADRLDPPIYFVLGNHDYYGGSVEAVRALAGRTAADTDRLSWLPATGPVPLTPSTALVGHGGWGDARFGDFMGSEVILNDYLLIAELRSAGTAENWPREPLAGWERKEALQVELQALGDDAAATLGPSLRQALDRFPRVVVLTHVPPLREACWHEGRISTDDWLPGFSCKALGDLLLEAAAEFPDREMTVLCGHTHGGGECRPLPNLLVLTQGARYGRPDFRVLEIE